MADLIAIALSIVVVVVVIVTVVVVIALRCTRFYLAAYRCLGIGCVPRPHCRSLLQLCEVCSWYKVHREREGEERETGRLSLKLNCWHNADYI